MPRKSRNSNLYLPELTVQGFRGFRDLSLTNLGRVTLIAGSNGVGKTTLLEAIRLYAARGRFYMLDNILRGREEFSPATDEDGDKEYALDWDALFYGREAPEAASILIGPKNKTHRLQIRVVPVSEENIKDVEGYIPENMLSDSILALEINFGRTKIELPVSYHSRMRWPPYRRLHNEKFKLIPEIICETLGPGLLNNTHISRLWDKVALTESEDQAVDALNLIAADGLIAERVAVVGDDRSSRRMGERRVVVKLKGQAKPVPLKSLGDGATRLFGIALAMANCPNGFLVLDEVENGIHYSVQYKFWNMILTAAQQNNVQVMATTHSWDCVTGFAQAAIDNTSAEGVLIRLEQAGDQVQAVEYSEKELIIAAEQRIEVR